MRCSYGGVAEEIVLWDVTPATVNTQAPADTAFFVRWIKFQLTNSCKQSL